MAKVQKKSFMPNVSKMIAYIAREPTSKEIDGAIRRIKRGAPLFDKKQKREDKKQK